MVDAKKAAVARPNRLSYDKAANWTNPIKINKLYQTWLDIIFK